MHVLITGATGFIGKHVLVDALIDNRITKVTVVGRRPPSFESKDMEKPNLKAAIIKKLTLITRDDLSQWDYDQDTELASALADCKACIWCIGGNADKFATPQEFERVCFTFTVNAANFLSKLAQSETRDNGKAFRFCYCSAKWANRKGTAGDGFLTFEAQSRNMKGRVETALLSIASQSNDKMHVFIFRPGVALSHKTVTSLGGLASSVASAALRMMPSVLTNVERVARVMVDASVGIRVEWQRQGQDGDKCTWESEEIVSWSLGLGV